MTSFRGFGERFSILVLIIGVALSLASPVQSRDAAPLPDYVVEAFEELHAMKDTLRGFRITHEPQSMRHFTCAFERI